MIILFWIITGIAVYHLIYQGIILPSIRLRLRYELFSLRDKLRALKTDLGESFDDNVFTYMQDSINGSIKLIALIDFSSIVSAEKRFRGDLELRDEIKKKQELIDNCPINKVKEISLRNAELLTDAVVYNAGGWFIYIVPVLLGVVCYKKIKSFVTDIVLFPEKEMNKFIGTCDCPSF